MGQGVPGGVSQQDVGLVVCGDMVQVVARQENTPAALVLEEIPGFTAQAKR